MRLRKEVKTTRVGRWLVRTWFGAVGLTTLILTGLFIEDYFRGEFVSHLGLGFFLELASLTLVAIGVALLPLLIVAVVVERKAKRVNERAKLEDTCASRAGSPSNNAIQLPVWVVTPRAFARVAPTQPAADRDRWTS